MAMAIRVFKRDLCEIQGLMAPLGYYPGEIDGVWGQMSYDGIKACIRDATDLQRPLPIPDNTSPPVYIRPSVDYRTAVEIALSEAVIRTAYKDSGGIWTWSVGLTSNTGHDVTRYIDAPQSMQHCMDLYVWALKRYTKQVDEVFASRGYFPNQCEYAGALDFHWNTGAIKRATWIQLLMLGNKVDAEASLKTWIKSGGRTMQALIDRRARCADLIFRNKWSANGEITEYTRLTKNYTPVWSSATQVDVRAELLKAFGNSVELALDGPAQPYSVPEVLTLTTPAA